MVSILSIKDIPIDEEEFLLSLSTRFNLVLPNLYIGNQQAVGWLPSFEDSNEKREKTLKDLNDLSIRSILCCADDTRVYPDHFKYMHLNLRDRPDFPILDRLDQTFHFIEEGRNDGGVIVHCNAGSSRSGAIMIAYLMRKNQWKYIDSVIFLRKIRPCINPVNFEGQLLQYEKNLGL